MHWQLQPAATSAVIPHAGAPPPPCSPTMVAMQRTRRRYAQTLKLDPGTNLLRRREYQIHLPLSCQAAVGWEAFGPPEADQQAFQDGTRRPTAKPQQAAPSPQLLTPAPTRAGGPEGPALLVPATSAQQRPSQPTAGPPPQTLSAAPTLSPTAKPSFLLPTAQATTGQGVALNRPVARPPNAPNEPSKATLTKAQARQQKVKFDSSDARVRGYEELPVSVEVLAGPSGDAQPPAPAPLRSFNHLYRKPYKFNHLLLGALAATRFQAPTPVQRHVVSAFVQGRDICAISPTGTGKTSAYLLPLLARLLKSSRDNEPNNTAYPRAVILAPTRELVFQVHEEVCRMVRHTHLKAVAVAGGDSLVTQVLALRGGCDLVVATPRRLLDLVVSRGAIHMGLTWALVLDEVDKMLDLGMEPEVARLLAHPQLSEGRQTCMLATRLPADVAAVASRYLRPGAVTVRVGAATGATPTVNYEVLPVSAAAKLAELGRLLGGPRAGLGEGDSELGLPHGGMTIVFANTMREANKVHEHIVSVLGLSAGLLHSGLPQSARDEAMHCFRYGVTPILVSTGLVGRGIDVPDVTQVINWDVPHSLTDYIQRCGRTGRLGRPGTATTLFTPADAAAAPYLVDVLRSVGQQPPAWLTQLAQAHAQGRGGVGGSAATGATESENEEEEEEEEEHGGRYLPRAAARAVAQAAAATPWADLLPPAGTNPVTMLSHSSMVKGAVSGRATPSHLALSGRYDDLTTPQRRAEAEAEGGTEVPAPVLSDAELLRRWHELLALRRAAQAESGAPRTA